MEIGEDHPPLTIRSKADLIETISGIPDGAAESSKEVLESSQKGAAASLPNQTVPSWAALVQNHKVLKQYDMEISMKDGVGSVEVPEEIFNDPSPFWEDFLIGIFLASAPHIAKVHDIVNKIWALGDKSQMIDVFQINSTTMKFRITNPTIRNRVTKRGMWNLADIPVIISKWNPMEEENQPEVKSVPIWVHMKNVPMNMFSWKGLSFTASPVGEPVRLHPETTQCSDFKVAKIFVKADLTKELPQSMMFTFKGKETLVKYAYP